MYLIFYLSALFRWENTYQASFMAWGRAGTLVFAVYLATALVGLAVRLYLISATAMDYHLLGDKYRILTPALFVLDMVWAMAPFLIADRIGLQIELISHLFGPANRFPTGQRGMYMYGRNTAAVISSADNAPLRYLQTS